MFFFSHSLAPFRFIHTWKSLFGCGSSGREAWQQDLDAGSSHPKLQREKEKGREGGREKRGGGDEYESILRMAGEF